MEGFSNKKTYINIDISIVQSVHLLSIGALTLFQEKYPELLDVLVRSKRPTSDWDFFMTAAGIGLAFLKSYPSMENIEDIMQSAEKIDKQIPDAIINLKDFLQKNKEIENDLPSDIGVWVLWNIGGKCPSHKEMERLAPAIGSYLDKLVDDFIIQ